MMHTWIGQHLKETVILGNIHGLKWENRTYNWEQKLKRFIDEKLCKIRGQRSEMTTRLTFHAIILFQWVFRLPF